MRIYWGLAAVAAAVFCMAAVPAMAEGYTGWKTSGDKTYWYEDGVLQGYDPDNAAYRGKEIYDFDSEAWYWLDNIQQGARAENKDVYQESDAGEWALNADGTGKWVRYDADGHMVKGWDETADGTYYFDTTYGSMAHGLVKIDGTYYYFDEMTGVLQSGETAERMICAAQVADLVNEARAQAGVSALTLDTDLTKAAMIRAEEIVTEFSHNRPDGTKCYTVLDGYGISFRCAGENIAKGQTSPEAVMEAWLNSEGHRANILDSDFEAIGVGYVEIDGYPYWAQLFVQYQ